MVSTPMSSAVLKGQNDMHCSWSLLITVKWAEWNCLLVHSHVQLSLVSDVPGFWLSEAAMDTVGFLIEFFSPLMI